MRADALKIGHIISISWRIAKIERIYKDTVGVEFLDDNGFDAFMPTDILPVAITEEMLVDNGFVFDGTAGYVLNDKKKNMWLRILPPQPDNDDWWDLGCTGFEFRYGNTCDMVIKGVDDVWIHQLQDIICHAGLKIGDILKTNLAKYQRPKL